MKRHRAAMPSSAASCSSCAAERPVADEHERPRRRRARASGRRPRSRSSTRLISVIRPSQPTTKPSSATPSSRAQRARAHRVRARCAARDRARAGSTAILSARRDPSATRSSRTSGLTAISASLTRASARSTCRKRGRLRRRRSSRAARGRGTCGRRPAAGPSPASRAAMRPTAPAFAVCVCRTSRPQLAGSVRTSSRTATASCSGEISRWSAADVDRLDAELLGDVLHRALALADASRDESSSRSRSGRARGSGTRRAAPARRR